MPKDRSPRRRPERENSRQATRPNRRIRLPLVFAGLSLIVAAFATYALLRSPIITAQTVRVVGTQTLDSQGLVDVSGLQGQSLFDLKLSEARKNLLSIPQVRSVSFERHWPQAVTIKVHERVPFAVWTVGGRDYVVDQDGYVLMAGSPEAGAPHVVEADATRIMGPGDRVHPDALSLAARITRESPSFLNQTVQQLDYAPGTGVTAVFSTGMRVTFGDERSYDYKVAVLSQLLGQLQARNFVPRDVDLRFGERVTYD